MQSQLTLYGNSGDAVGYGTYVASVILQLAPSARITSIGVYPGGRFNRDWQAGGMQWLVSNAKSFDVVLYDLPPRA